MTRVIISLTTVPNRINTTLKPCLDVLDNMSYENYEIHLNLPKVCKRTGENYFIPNFISKYKKVRVFFGVDDYGPATKLVPTIFRSNPDDILITVDDDILYEDGFIEAYLDKSIEYPNCVLCFAGVKIENIWASNALIKYDEKVDCMGNFGTAFYKRYMFKSNLIDEYVNKCWDDDVSFSCHLRDNKIDIIRVTPPPKHSLHCFPVVEILPTPYGGCDIFRDGGHKSDMAAVSERYKKLMDRDELI